MVTYYKPNPKKPGGDAAITPAAQVEQAASGGTPNITTDLAEPDATPESDSNSES